MSGLSNQTELVIGPLETNQMSSSQSDIRKECDDLQCYWQLYKESVEQGSAADEVSPEPSATLIDPARFHGLENKTAINFRPNGVSGSWGEGAPPPRVGARGAGGAARGAGPYHHFKYSITPDPWDQTLSCRIRLGKHHWISIPGKCPDLSLGAAGGSLRQLPPPFKPSPPHPDIIHVTLFFEISISEFVSDYA